MNDRKKLLKGFYCYIFSHDITEEAIEDMELSNSPTITVCKRCNGDMKIWKDADCKDDDYWEKEI